MDANYRMIFDHLVQKLQSQQEHLAQLRNRASISAAITGLIATFFAAAIGSERLGESLYGEAAFGLSLGAIFLLLLFSGSIAFAGMTMVHQNDFTFSFNASKMFEKIHESEESTFFSQYINDGEWYFGDNEQKIDLAQTHLFWSTILGWTQIFAWLLLL